MQTPLIQRVLPGIIGVLVVFALAVPARVQGWAASIGNAVTVLSAPVSGPVLRVANILGPNRTRPSDDALRVLEEERERIQGELLRQQQENDRLRQVIRDLQSGLALTENLPVRLIEAPVIGTGSDPDTGMLTIKAGAAQGVNTDAVGLAPGLQLMGRVVRVSDRTCTLRLITAKGGESITAMVMLQENVPDGLKCTLTPVGDGSLRGPVSDRRDPGTNAPIEPQPGQTVRLDDTAWPRASQMLKLGVVESVEPNPNQPLRRIITVRPTVLELERVSDVMLCTPTSPAGQGESTGGAK